MELVELLKSVELFAGLDDEQLSRLAAITQMKSYKEGDVVIERGASGQELYMIRDGQVEVVFADADEKEAPPTLYLGRGQVFGEMALIDYGERSATIRCATENTQLATISRVEFEGLCEADTAIGYVVMRNMATDISFKLRHRNMER